MPTQIIFFFFFFLKTLFLFYFYFFWRHHFFFLFFFFFLKTPFFFEDTIEKFRLLISKIYATYPKHNRPFSISRWKSTKGFLRFRVKGEVQSRITIISKERVKISLQIGAKNDENRIRNKEVVTFWNFTFFRKTFLDQSLWIFKWVSWWCHRLTICHIYYTWNSENFHFFPDTGKSISLYQNISE